MGDLESDLRFIYLSRLASCGKEGEKPVELDTNPGIAGFPAIDLSPLSKGEACCAVSFAIKHHPFFKFCLSLLSLFDLLF